MAKLTTGDIMAIVLGSLLFLLVTGIILYYFIFSGAKKSNYSKFLDHYQNLDYKEKKSFTDSLITNPRDVNTEIQKEVPEKIISPEESYRYRKVFTEDEENSYPEPTVNDQILREVATDTTPVR